MTSTPPWTAERVVDVPRARRLVGGVAPELRGLPVVPLAAGWDNTVFDVGGRWTARFPRRATALPGLRRELAVLPRIAGRLPLPVPAPVWVGEDADPAGSWPFAVAALVPGRELAGTGLPDGDRGAVAAALGRFLRALHAPSTRSAVADLALPVDPMSRSWPAARLEATRAVLTRLADAGTWPADPAVDRMLQRAGRLGEPGAEPVLVHGDLHVRHVLVGDDGRASGVIDWGDTCLADPAVDLSIAYAAFAGEARRALLDAYGPVPGERELRARALAVRLSALLAEYAAAEGLGAVLAEALAGLDRASA